jgi:hypothetical protein
MSAMPFVNASGLTRAMPPKTILASLHNVQRNRDVDARATSITRKPPCVYEARLALGGRITAYSYI